MLAPFKVSKRIGLACRFILAASCLVAATASAQILTPFAARYTGNESGDIQFFGNQLLTCPISAANCAAARAGTLTSTAGDNNAFVMEYIDVDADPTTFNSSRALVTLPAGAEVLFAGLYWGGDLAVNTGGKAAPVPASANRVLVRFPGDNAYTTIVGTVLGARGSTATGSGDYAGFANLTTQVQARGNGDYTVANVQAGTGQDADAGWVLTIAYRAPGEPPRNLTVFDGFALISNSATVTIPVSGFTTPQSGPVRTRIGSVAFEGDVGLTGDTLSVNSTILTDALHPSNNSFKSTFSRLGSRYTTKTPDYVNLMAVDASVFNANGILANNASAANIVFRTSNDVYFPTVATFATELFSPNVSALKQVQDLNGGQALPGDTLRYTITVNNSGDDAAVNLLLRDTIPDNTAYVSNSLQIISGANAGVKSDTSGNDQAEYLAGSNEVVFRLGTGANATTGGRLASAGSTSLRFDVRISDGVPNQTNIINQASLTFNAETLGTALSAVSSAPSLTAVRPVLSLEKSVIPNPASAGGEILYTLNFANTGGASASGTVLNDSIPANTTFISASGGGTIAAGEVTWNLGVLAAGASGQVTLRLRVISPLPNGTVISNSAALTATGTGPVTAQAATTVSSEAFLTLAKSASQSTVLAGGTITYTLDYSNVGSDIASSVVITDTLPINTSFVSASGDGSLAGSVVSWNLGNLAAGSHGSVLLILQVDSPLADGTQVVNVAQIAASGLAPISSQSTVTVSSEPLLQISKQDTVDPVEAGASLGYTILVSNVGTDVALNTVIIDRIPDETDFVSATAGGIHDLVSREVRWTIGDLPAGQSTSVGLSVVVKIGTPNALEIINEARTRSDQTGFVTATETTRVASAAVLKLTKTEAQDPVSAGNALVYTLAYENTGNVAAINATITDEIPDFTTFVSASSDGLFNIASETVTWSLGDIPAGTSGSVTLQLAVDTPLPDATVIVNAATLSSDDVQVVATASTTVVSAPVLTLSKQTESSLALAGETLTYTLLVKNIGSDAASDVVLTDQLPLNTSFISASSGGALSGDTVTWSLGNLPAGSESSVTLTVLVATPLATGSVISNIADASSAQTTPVSALFDVRVSSSPNLTIEKSAPLVAAAGEQFNYAITIENNGTDSASGVIVTDALPSGVAFVSASDNGEFDGAAQVSWNIGVLAAGDSRTFTITVSIIVPQVDGTGLTNVASVNSDQTTPQSALAQTVASSTPILSIIKTADPSPVAAGTALTYTLEFTNNGNADASGVLLVDRLPADTSFVSASDGGTFDPGTGEVSWSITSIPAGSSGAVTLIVNVAAPLPNSAQLINQATLSSDQTGPVTGGVVTLVASAPNLAIDKIVDQTTATPAGFLNYEIVVSNSGSDQASDVVITDTLPQQVIFVSADNGGAFDTASGLVTWNLGTLAVGTSQVLGISVQLESAINNGLQLVNSVSAESTTTAPVSASATTVVSSAPLLSLGKLASADTVAAGGTVTYTLDFANLGSDIALNAQLVDSIPAGMLFVSATNGGIYNADTGEVVWSLGNVAVGASGQLVLTLQIPNPVANGQVFTNTALLSAANGVPDSAIADVTASSNALLALTKSAEPEAVIAGDVITYRLAFANNGSDVARNVVLTDALPANTVFVSASSSGIFDGALISWSLGDVPAGSTGEVVLQARADTPLANGTLIANSAALNADNAIAANADATTTVSSAALLSLSKSTTQPFVAAGGQITFQLEFANIGNDTAAGVVLTDALPANTSLIAASGGGVQIGSDIVWNFADLPAGATGSVSVSFTVDSPLANGTSIDNTATLSADNAGSVLGAASTKVNSEPQLTLAKIDSADPVAAGGELSWTLNFANVGADQATSVVLVDTLPIGVRFVSASAGGQYDAVTGEVTWLLGALSAGTSGSVTVNVIIDSPLTNGSIITNTAELSSAQTAPVTATEQTAVASTPLLRVTKTALANPVLAGAELSYVLKVENIGNDIATGINLVDMLDSPLIFVSASSGGQFDVANGTVSWLVGSLAAGGTVQYALTVQVASPLPNGTTLTNAATAESNELPPVSDVESVLVTSAPLIELTKSASAASVAAGGGVTYTLTARNTGTDTATGVVITDQIPFNTVFESASAGAILGVDTVSWNIGSLTAGSESSVTLSVRIVSPLAEGTVITNNADVLSDQNLPIAASVEVIATSAPLLTIEKSGPVIAAAGERISYVINVANIGSDSAGSVQVNDTLPQGLTFVSASDGGVFDGISTVTWELGVVAANQQRSLTLIVDVVSPQVDGTQLTNLAAVSSDQTSPQTAVAQTIIGSSPILSLSKSADVSPVAAGGELVYTLTFANDGNADASGVVLTDQLPSQINFVSASDGGTFDALTREVSWNIASLPAGASGVRTLTTSVISPLADGTALLNVAILNANESGPVTATESTPVASAPNLSIDKTVDAVSAAPGSLLTYTITVANTGSDAATSVEVQDVLPVGAGFSNADNDAVFDAPGNSVLWNLGSLPAGGTRTLTLLAEIASAIGNGSALVNVASVQSSETPPLSDDAITTVVTSGPALNLLKTIATPGAGAGAEVIFDLSFANIGNGTANAVTLVDDLPAGLLFISASDGGSFDGATGQVAWSLGDVAAGVAGIRTLTVQLPNPVDNNTQFINTATLSADNALSDRASASVTAISGAELVLSKSVNPNVVSVGDRLTYTLSLTNSGSVNAENVVLEDPLPTGTRFVSASDDGLIQESVVVWNLGILSVGESREIQLVVDIDALTGTSLVNQATASSDNAPTATGEVAISFAFSVPVLTPLGLLLLTMFMLVIGGTRLRRF